MWSPERAAFLRQDGVLGVLAATPLGSITLGVTIVAALAALSARETYRIPMNQLGEPNAVPMNKAEYDRLRGQTVAADKVSRASA